MDHSAGLLCTVTVDCQASDGIRVLRIAGELDAFTAPEVERALLELSGPGHFVADLSDLDFLSAAGLDLFVRLRERSAAQGRTFWVENPQPMARRVLALLDLEYLLEGPDRSLASRHAAR